ncbi:hypothetical protein BGI41_02255 [Methanobrevibacter sp. 87.7]|uniref:restriction endonuclease n=1 Tax=Methanobrevibacter sp. 87.7 TaxID=387957 RepID=UPI000B50517D|nr:restriction endonuclease [Methanobrevibacter sp. 87.7]OWT33461.1 hypothetical protein BGI41_02255 [Methanobrevibacter sp. 87.7]
MQKPQLINFIAKVMEDSGFKVYKNFKTSQTTIDIYAVLPTQMGDFSVVVACKNYDKEWEVGIDILKEMEMVGRTLKASKVAIVTSSTFSPQARNYASRKNIKLVDRDNLISLAKKYSEKNNIQMENQDSEEEEDVDSSYYYDENNDGYYEDYDDNYDYDYDDVESMPEYPEYNGYDYDEPYDDEYYENLAISNYNPSTQSNSNNYYFNGANLYKTSSNSTNKPKKSRFSFFNRNSKDKVKPEPRPIKNNNSGIASLSKSNNVPKNNNKSRSIDFISIIRNPIVLILIVVIVSYLIAGIFAFVGGVSSGIIGLIEMVFSLLLSYGLVWYTDKDGTVVLVKGTSVFFISLVILIVLIIFL